MQAKIEEDMQYLQYEHIGICGYSIKRYAQKKQNCNPDIIIITLKRTQTTIVVKYICYFFLVVIIQTFQDTKRLC